MKSGDFRLRTTQAIIIALLLIAYSQIKHLGANDLLLLLTPTAWGVRMLLGYSFIYDELYGYVDTFHQVVIAPSCAGARFYITTCITLCSCITRTHAMYREVLKIALISWGITIFANVTRIISTIYVSNYLSSHSLFSPLWLHEAIGSFIYLSILIITAKLYHYNTSTLSTKYSHKRGSKYYPPGPIPNLANTHHVGAKADVKAVDYFVYRVLRRSHERQQ